MQTGFLKRKRIIAILLLVIAVWIGWRLFVPHEQVYRERPVSDWVRQLQPTQLGQTNEVLDTLLDIGPDSLPPLVAELRVQDNILTRSWQQLWPKLPFGLRKALPKPLSRVERRSAAAWALGQIGPAAGPVAPALVVALHDPEPKVRANAAEALRWVRCKTPETINALARCLSDKESWVRSCAATALWDLAPESQAAVPRLIQTLTTPDQAHKAALCLQELGPLASNAVPALIEVVNRGAAGRPPEWKFPVVAGADGKPDGKDHSAHTRAMAAKALGKIGIASVEVIETLNGALSYPSSLEGMPERRRPWVRQNAAEALGLLGTNAIQSIPALVKALDETDPRALQEITLALGAMGVHARSALPLLTNLLGELPERFAARAGIGGDRKWELFWLRSAVARAISQIDPADQRALALLFEQADADYAARRYLASLGTAATPFIPALIKKLSMTNGQPLTATAELLWHIDPKNPAVLPAISQAMQQTNSAVRAYAAYWYWKVSGDADAAIEVIVAGLEEPPSNASQVFPQWLSQMGSAARPAVPALKKALWHHDTYTRRNAGKALEKIEPAALEVPSNRR